MVRYFFLLIFLLTFNVAYTQGKLTTKSKKAEKYYRKALGYYKQKNADAAIKEIEKCRKQDSLFIELWLLKGDIQHLLGDTIGEINSYKRAINISVDFFPNVHFLLAELLFSKNNIVEALYFYNSFIKYSRGGNRNRIKAFAAIKNCNYALRNAKDSLVVEFSPLYQINTDDDEYWPFVSASGKEFYFTRKTGRGKYENEDLYKVEDFVLSDKDNLKQDSCLIKNSVPGKEIPLAYNTIYNEGNMTMTADGKFVYFSASDRNDGFGRFDIYMVRKGVHGWSLPVNIGNPVNTTAWESQPSVSPDGKTLYFASNRKGGKGKSDIWVTKLLHTLKNGRQIWSEPRSLSFNTEDDDMAPFVYFDNSTLFFSSKGYPGMGGFDIFKVGKKKGVWGNPINIGVNNKYDNIGFALSPDGSTAYFSSVTGKGDKDIFYFSMPKQYSALPTINVFGEIADIYTGEKINSKIELVKYINKSDSSFIYYKQMGYDYFICLQSKGLFSLSVVAKGYQFYSKRIDLRDSLNFSSVENNILLSPISLNSKINLSNIYFDFDSYGLKEESYPELHRLKEYLQLNNNIRIEIAGHTDNVGGEEYNIDLSLKRAREVYKFLIENGISEERLTYKGYGSRFPDANNSIDESRRQNRRTEIKIIGID